MPQGEAMKSNETNKPKSNLGGGTLISGEPDAVKVARPVRRGECGNMPITSGEHRMAHGESAPSLDRSRAMLLPYSNEADLDPREIGPLPRNILQDHVIMSTRGSA